MDKYTIEVRTVGQAYGCEGSVLLWGRVVATSRVCPYGMRGVAYAAAEALLSTLKGGA